MDTNLRPAAEYSGDTISNYLARYRAGLNGFDEMFDANGRVRPHWEPVVSFLEAEGPAACHSRSERIQRRIVENGLTLDSFTDPDKLEQPWRLDLLPLVFEASEWQKIAQAMMQRMRLFEALLDDIYGAQSVLDEGLLPPSLVFNDPAFVRPLHGIDKGSASRLMFMAADLGRDRHGQWRIIDTHAETTAGHGYALANRVVLAEASARLFRSCNAQRVSGFHQSVAEELAQRTGLNAPTIAILGPNPDHETYLSHAYMARYLGYLLLEGSDLRVLDEKVFHKTLAGLQPIDLLVRAVEAAKADPLELDPSGFDGPAGLVQAVRSNPSLVSNALGTAVIENRGIAPYIAALSQRLIGEEQLLPDAPRLWLGNSDARNTFLSDPDAYILRQAFESTARPGHANPGYKLSELDKTERDGLLREVELNGAHYVAETPFGFATAPSWTADGLVAKPYALRVFVAATENGYLVMPGGLALTIGSGAAISLSDPRADSRDVWVGSDEPQGPHYSRWRISEEESQVQRLGSRLPSRIADNLFWLGRYVERADWTMRVMRNALSRGDEDLRPIRRDNAAESAIETIISKGRSPLKANAKPEPKQTLEERVENLFSSTGNAYGLMKTFQNIRRVARQSRDRLSLDAWRLLSALRIDQPTGSADPAVELIERLDIRIAELAAFNGLMHENMTRNFGWRFTDIGRRIERAYQMAEFLRLLLQASPSDVDETDRLAFILETSDSFMTYRARYRFAPTFPLVLDLLLVDETNPRGIAFQLVELHEHISNLPKASQDAVRTPDQRLALELLTQIRLADIDAMRVVGKNGERAALKDALDRLIAGLPQLSDIVSRRYFSLTEEQPQRVHTRLAP
ncbi:MAG: circularly permuted type 2 ATP-grasp protein [Hyphomicrobiaceae bacterium]